MLKRHHVERIVIVNGDVAEIHIKKDSLKLPEYAEVNKKSFGSGTNTGPHYYLKIASIESFVTNLNEAQKEFSATEKIYPEKQIQDKFKMYVDRYVICKQCKKQCMMIPKMSFKKSVKI